MSLLTIEKKESNIIIKGSFTLYYTLCKFKIKYGGLQRVKYNCKALFQSLEREKKKGGQALPVACPPFFSSLPST